MSNYIKTVKKRLSGVSEYRIVYDRRMAVRPIVTSSKNIFEFISPMYSDIMCVQECFYVITLNRALHVTGYKLISIGSMCAAVVDSIQIMKIAIESMACGIVLIHNHPSDNKKPSDSDIKLTKRIKECCALFEINLIDHLILTESGYLSFADEGIL